MNISQHAQVFKAYIDRASVADLELILSAVRDTWREQMNGNAGSQSKADQAVRSAIENALERMLTSDRANIAAIAAKTINRA